MLRPSDGSVLAERVQAALRQVAEIDVAHAQRTNRFDPLERRDQRGRRGSRGWGSQPLERGSALASRHDQQIIEAFGLLAGDAFRERSVQAFGDVIAHAYYQAFQHPSARQDHRPFGEAAGGVIEQRGGTLVSDEHSGVQEAHQVDDLPAVEGFETQVLADHLGVLELGGSTLEIPF